MHIEIKLLLLCGISSACRLRWQVHIITIISLVECGVLASQIQEGQFNLQTPYIENLGFEHLPQEATGRQLKFLHSLTPGRSYPVCQRVQELAFQQGNFCLCTPGLLATDIHIQILIFLTINLQEYVLINPISPHMFTHVYAIRKWALQL